MAASPFTILHLRPGRYSRRQVDRQYRRVRRQILRAGGPDRQRRLDDALIAHAMLRTDSGQVSLIERVRRNVAKRPRRAPMTIEPAPQPFVDAAAPPPRPSDDACGRFASMVVDHVESGILRFTSRRRLVLLAEGLGIATFKANLIIAEVLHDLQHGRRPAAAGAGRYVAEPFETPRRRRYGLRLAVALAAAVLADLLLMLLLG